MRQVGPTTRGVGNGDGWIKRDGVDAARGGSVDGRMVFRVDRRWVDRQRRVAAGISAAAARGGGGEVVVGWLGLKLERPRWGPWANSWKRVVG